MSYTLVTSPGRGRRRPALLLLAVIAPSLALIVLSLRMISQEGQLSESRLAEEHEQAIREFGQMVVLTADRHRSNAISTNDLPSAVVFVGSVEDGKLILPWQRGSGVNTIETETNRSAFSQWMTEGERQEFRNAGLSQAIQAYRRAREVARDSVQRAYAETYLSRSLQKANRTDEADALRRHLISLPLHLVDEFSIPLAFYAAQSMAADTSASTEIIDMLERVPSRQTLMSPQAGFLLRSIADTISITLADSAMSGRVEAARTESDQSIRAGRLQEDFDHVFALLSSSNNEKNSSSTWTIYGDDLWLVGISESAEAVPSLAVVIDVNLLTAEVTQGMQLTQRGYNSPVLTASASPASQWLGPSLPGVHLALTKVDGGDRLSSLGLRYAFFLLAMTLVVGLAALGAFLWWRDTKREVQLAQMRSDFVSSVSHELKTPLTSIRMFTETLRFRQPSDEARRKYLDTILSESARLTRLLNNVLDFSKIEKGSKQYSFEPVSLQVVTDTALQTLAHPFQAKGFSIATHYPEEDVLVFGDSDALEQVILNLLSNAMKFSDAQREIIVSLEKNGSMAVLEIQDFGMGIETEEADHIFDRFFRARGVRDRGIPGTGLGLSIAQHAVEAHDGQIRVKSLPGEGSTFSIHIPLLKRT